ncbi:hypothetical protein [Deinococcus phoenicis]|nr:hypothetical protein [Deinococcus phoenicis]
MSAEIPEEIREGTSQWLALSEEARTAVMAEWGRMERFLRSGLTHAESAETREAWQEVLDWVEGRRVLLETAAAIKKRMTS